MTTHHVLHREPRSRFRRAWLISACVMGTTAILSAATRSDAVDSVDGRFAMMQRRIDSLENRLATEELRRLTATAPARVKAPFEVVDAGGNVFFSVEGDSATRGVVLKTAKGQTAVALGFTAGVSFLKVLSPDRKREVLAATDKTNTAVALRDGDDGQHNRAVMAIGADGVPAMLINNEKHVGVLSVTHGPHGGGLIQLDEPKGDPRVELGSTADGFGVVKVGPGGQCSAPFGPIAPSCLLGRKGQ